MNVPDDVAAGVLRCAAIWLEQSRLRDRYFLSEAIAAVISSMAQRARIAANREAGEVMWGEGFPNKVSACYVLRAAATALSEHPADDEVRVEQEQGFDPLVSDNIEHHGG